MYRLYQIILRSFILLIVTTLYTFGQNNPAILLDTSWHLKSFESMDDAIGTLTPDNPLRYTMTLKHDGTVTMELNCNRAGGTWSATSSSDGASGQLTFGPLAMTNMLCPPPSLDTKIATDAQYIRSYLLKDGNLHLSLMADGGIYTWEPDTNSSYARLYKAPIDGGARYWEVNGTYADLHESASSESTVITRYGKGTILNNLGCEHLEQSIWCDVQQLGGGVRGYVEAVYLKPLLDTNGNTIIGENDSALRSGEGKFNATGKINCSIDNKPKTTCEYGIAYAQGSDASMVIKKPDGHTRVIFLQLGKPMGADTSQADGYPDFKVSKETDLYLVDLGHEYYEIPDTIINP